MTTLSNLHNQTLTNSLTEDIYDTVVVHLAEQLAAQSHPDMREEAHKSAIDALANYYGATEDQTILDWLRAVARRIGCDGDACAGV